MRKYKYMTSNTMEGDLESLEHLIVRSCLRLNKTHNERFERGRVEFLKKYDIQSRDSVDQ